jgi:hypothetical protein
MRAVEVSGGALEGISRKLLQAAQELDACGGSAPASVDAGPWTPLIASMLAKVSTAAAAVAEGVGTASQGVTDSATSYSNADAAARTNLTPGAR